MKYCRHHDRVHRATDIARLVTALLLGVNAGISLARTIRQTVDEMSRESTKNAAVKNTA